MTTSTVVDHEQTATGALAAGVPAVEIFDLAQGPSASLACVITNTGNVNAITTVDVARAARAAGADFAVDVAIGPALGAIAAAASESFELAPQSMRRLRVTLTSAAGTTYRIAVRVF